MLTDDDDPLRKFTAMQRKLAEMADPGGIKAMQRDMARLVDPAVSAMQMHTAHLAYSGAIKAMQRDYTRAVASIAMQRDMARLLANSSAIKAMQRDYTRAVAGIAMQRDMARLLANSPAIKAIQGLADSPAIKIMQRDYARLAGLGAIQLTARLAPGVSIDALARTVSSISSGLLGTAAKAVAAAFPRHTQLAIETMSALTVLEMAEHDDGHIDTLEEESPLVAAIADLRAAFADSHSTTDVEQRVNEVFDRVVDKLQSRASSPKAPYWDLAKISTFLSLLFAAISIGFNISGELRAQRQEDEAAKSQLLADARSAKLQRALDRLVELHEQEVERRAATTPNDKATLADKLYVVQRAVVLRERKDTRSRRLLTLHPGTVVEVIGQAGQKIQVQYFDHLRGEKQIGWVLKKYLVRLEQ